ncbi:hypothetical protein chiPu_0027565, partial [Chiloscyllium punctatum]|nr:hypothetical protein [Chiloscyllium punctatum]
MATWATQNRQGLVLFKGRAPKEAGPLVGIFRTLRGRVRVSLDEGNRTFHDIPATVTLQASQNIADTKASIRNIGANIMSTAETVQFNESLRPVTDSLQSTQVTEVTQSVKQYDRY